MHDHNIIVSASKDTFVKFWDIDTEHNFRTIVEHRSEVWGLAIVKNDQYLVTGCNDNEIRVWKIFFVDTESTNIVPNLENFEANSEADVSIKFFGLAFFSL